MLKKEALFGKLKVIIKVIKILCNNYREKTKFLGTAVLWNIYKRLLLKVIYIYCFLEDLQKYLKDNCRLISFLTNILKVFENAKANITFT